MRLPGLRCRLFATSHASTTRSGAMAPVRLAVLSCLFLLVTAHSADAETRYFKVAEWPKHVHHDDSYVLPLTNPDDIAHAEDLIRLGPEEAGSAIVFAHVAPGADGINRDLNQKDDPLWSWHVTEFVSFADMTAEIYDGWPTFVEQDVDSWMNNTGGQIGFWSYTVVEDVTYQVPEPSTLALLCMGLSGLALHARRRRPS